MNNTISKPYEISIDPKLKNEIKSKKKEDESQVIVHCSIYNPFPCGLRIWKNTNLVPREGFKKSELVYADNISFYPKITDCSIGYYYFTLVFKGLPKECLSFDLVENIPESGGFIKRNITRNRIDVYKIKL